MALLCFYVACAVPTQSKSPANAEKRGLIDSNIIFLMKDGQNVEIEPMIANEIGYLKLNTEMKYSANRELKTEYYLDMDSDIFKLVIDYLKTPINEREDWIKARMDIAPNLISAADYLMVDYMLKDVGYYQCHDILYGSKTREEIQLLLSKFDKSMQSTFQHCIDLSIEDSNLRNACHRGIVGLRMSWNDPRDFVNVEKKCVDYIKQHRLSIVMSPYATFKYTDLRTFSESASSLEQTDLDIELNVKEAIDPDLLVSSLKRVRHLKSLRIVCKQASGIIDMQEIPELPKLNAAWFHSCSLSHSAQFFQKEFPELTMLIFYRVENLENIGYICSMPKLQELTISSSGIEDISQLLMNDLPSLIELDLSNNRIKCIGNVDLMPNLKTIRLDNNKIKDISELISSRLTDECKISLKGNPIIENIGDIDPEIKKKLVLGD